MVATLVRLKLTLLRHSYRSGGSGKIALSILGALWAAGLTFAALAGLIGARMSSPDDARAWVVTSLFGLGIGWTVLPILLFGSDDTLDPHRFALFPVRARQLLPGLLVSGMLGLPGISLCLISLTQIITWSRAPLPTIIAVVSAPLGALTCFLTSRVVTSGFSDALSSRRMRDAAAVVLGIVAMLGGVANQLISAAARRGQTQLDDVAHRAETIASWTPLGWAWAAPADAATGHPVSAVSKLVLAAAFVGGMWLLWGRLLDRSLETPARDTSGGTVKAHSLLDRLTGSSPTGAVAGRCLRYWRRDPRYLTSLTSMIITPAIICFSLRGAHSGLFVAPVILATMVGPTLMSDLAYDNSAFWLHVVSPMSMRADRWGRARALALIIVPILLVAAVGLAVITGNWHDLLWCLDLCIVALGTAMGLSLFQGARTPGTAPPPGGSAFGRGSSGGFAVAIALLGCWFATAVACSPVIVLVVLGLAWVALPVAILIAGVALVLGVRAGAKRMESTLPELLGKIST